MSVYQQLLFGNQTNSNQQTNSNNANNIGNQSVSSMTYDQLMAHIKNDIPQLIKNQRTISTMPAVVYNHEDGYMYEDFFYTDKPLLDRKIMNFDEWRKWKYPTETELLNNKSLAAAQIDDTDKHREEDFYTNDFLGKYQDYKKLIATAPSAKSFIGALITSADYSLLQTNNNLTTTLGLTVVRSILLETVQIERAEGLKAKIQRFSGANVEKRVPENKKVEPKKGTVTQTEYEIMKDVAVVEITGEAQLKIVDRDVFKINVDDLARKLERAKAEKIFEAADGAQTVTGADWGPHTAGISTNNPEDTFGPINDTFEAEGYPITHVMSNRNPWSKYKSNYWVKGQFVPSSGVPVVPGIKRSVPGFEGEVTWGVDNIIPVGTKVWALAKPAFPLTLYQSFVRGVEIIKEEEFTRESIVRDFNDTFLTNTNAIREVLSVAT